MSTFYAAATTGVLLRVEPSLGVYSLWKNFKLKSLGEGWAGVLHGTVPSPPFTAQHIFASSKAPPDICPDKTGSCDPPCDASALRAYV
jgi:hypothetical protein